MARCESSYTCCRRYTPDIAATKSGSRYASDCVATATSHAE
jgi:hypothetical protein